MIQLSNINKTYYTEATSLHVLKGLDLNIETGDYVLVDREAKYGDGDVVLAIIDGLATIKEFYPDKTHNRIILKANSDHEYMPIYIGEDDQFIINGKVVDVIKN